MAWSLTGRGKVEAERVAADFAVALQQSATPSSDSSSLGTIDSLRARLRQIQKEVHVRERAIASIPEMQAVKPPVAEASGRPMVPRPTPHAAPRMGAFAPPLPPPRPLPAPGPEPWARPQETRPTGGRPRRATPPPIPREETRPVSSEDPREPSGSSAVRPAGGRPRMVTPPPIPREEPVDSEEPSDGSQPRPPSRR